MNEIQHSLNAAVCVCVGVCVGGCGCGRRGNPSEHYNTCLPSYLCLKDESDGSTPECFGSSFSTEFAWESMKNDGN